MHLVQLPSLFLPSQGKAPVDEYEFSDEFRELWKLKVRELLTENEWRRRKLPKRVRLSAPRSSSPCFSKCNGFAASFSSCCHPLLGRSWTEVFAQHDVCLCASHMPSVITKHECEARAFLLCGGSQMKEEEQRITKDEAEEQKKAETKKKHDKKWEETRDNRVSTVCHAREQLKGAQQPIGSSSPVQAGCHLPQREIDWR